MNAKLDRLGGEKYVSLTTFRRNGEPVATPVWVARHGDKLVVSTGASSGKAKRLGHTNDILLAPCDMRGNVSGSATAGTARLLGPAGTEEVVRLIQKKYGVMARLIGVKDGAEQVLARLRGRAKESSRVGIEIVLTEAD